MEKKFCMKALCSELVFGLTVLAFVSLAGTASRHCRARKTRQREDRAAYRHERRDERKRGSAHRTSSAHGSCR